MTTTDVAIVGAGPAGLAAGIWARELGLDCIVIERGGGPRSSPGETLHPGAGSILRQLGVHEVVEAASAIRHEGVLTAWGGSERFSPYGDQQHGYQVMREDLGAILLDRLIERGGEVLLSTRAIGALSRDGVAEGVSTTAGDIRARVTVDASGASGWLRRSLDVGIREVSPPLIAQYGYRRGVLQDDAAICGDAAGWAWTAQVKPDLVQWTTMAFAPGGLQGPPTAVLQMDPVGKTRSARVTWREATRMAGPGYFIVGDAAATVDPASSHGVLRALMSGMMAMHQAAALNGGDADADGPMRYDAWMREWSARDMRELARTYADLEVGWAVDLVGRLTPTPPS